MLPAADLTEILANLAALQLAPAAQILAAVFAPLLRRLGSRAPAAARRTAAAEAAESPAAEADRALAAL